METVDKIYADLKAKGVAVEVDDRDNYTTGWKFNEWEMKGVPVRVEIGPKDIENNQAMVFRRDTLEKDSMPLEGLADAICDLFDVIHNDMFEKQENIEKTIHL